MWTVKKYTGKCGYRTLNFKIIPSELESLGKKVCVDDHGSVFTKAVIVNSPSTASPAHKNVKQENKLSIVSDVPTVQQTWPPLL